jgi:hypothetical protein
VILNAHGGDLNGFFLIRGEPTKLGALIETTDWMTHVKRGILHEEGFGVMRGSTGDQVMERLNLWMDLIPK